MKSIKQTVYLPTKVDTGYDRCSFNDTSFEWSFIEHLDKKEAFIFTLEQLNEYIESVIKQALETAADNVMIIGEPDLGRETIAKEINISKHDTLLQEYVFYPSKQSILNTFDEIFNKFKI